jgi:uncharacterized protein (TIGR03437 family)
MVVASFALLVRVAALGQPAITGGQNNYSYITPGLPNYGIAPGTLFIITGSGLANTTTATLQSTGGSGIPLTLNGASLSVTVNGVTTHPGIYYAIATQIAAVLPSSTPVGTGNITVTYNGVASSPASIIVVPSALGLDTYYGTGSGLGVATDPVNGSAFNYTNSASPGKSIVLWGSGLGADMADSDTTFTATPHAVNVPLTIYIGGVQAPILYQGSSGYPGVNQINVTIPSSVAPGCGVSVVAQSGTFVSNSVTLPINPGGGVCSDPLLGTNGSQLQTPGTKVDTSIGQIFLLPPNQVVAIFEHVTGVNASVPNAGLSVGNCAVSFASTSTTPPVSTTTGAPLDAGTLSVTGPAGTLAIPEAQVSIQSGTGPTGTYSTDLPDGFVPLSGGSFTFSGTGGTTPGASVGAFTTTLNFIPLVWSNIASIAAVDRAQGVTVTWTGGVPNSTVAIVGEPLTNPPGISLAFSCLAPVGAGQFTVPSYILEAMPAGPSLLEASSQTFTAAGLNTGSVIADLTQMLLVPFN